MEGITDDQVQQAYTRLDELLATNATGMVSDAVAEGLLAVVAACPTANPSDLWHHVIYRRLRYGLDWSDNSWKRVSGFALERALRKLYTPRLG